MSRPVTISDDDILQAARALFTEKGPQATTAEIAARAGVSEGILFKRFGSKARLHKAAMSSQMIGSLIQRETTSQGPLRTQKDFLRFLHWHVGVMREVVPLIVMAWSSRSFTAELPADMSGPKPPPLVAIRAIADMLEAEMKAGHLARRNADAIARIMLGAVWHFVFLELVLGKTRAGMDEDTFVAELARQVFSDLDPTREPVAKPKKK